MKGFFLFTFLSVILSTHVFSNTGSLTGKVIDAETGESLIGATIVVTGTTKGTITDFDGNYTLSGLEPGTISVTVQYVSYDPQRFDDIEIIEGEIAFLDISLGQVVLDIREVQVVTRRRERTEAAMQVMQRKSATVMDGISAQQIGKLGDSDAAGALQRATGVSVQEGKYIYVRGLSDRYMKVTLNGAEIPSLDPNINTVQMDLFPNNIIENMVVRKSYSVEHPSFTGGLVDIKTRDFPEKFNLQLSTGFEYNPQVSFIDDFLHNEKGSKDWFGIDDGTRNVPDEATGIDVPRPSQPGRMDTIRTIAASFRKNFEGLRSRTFFGHGHRLSLGNKFNLGERELGIIGAISYKKNLSYYENGQVGQYRALNADQMQLDYLLDEVYGVEDVIWSALLGGSFKINHNHKIGFTILHNQNGTSGSRYREGLEAYDDNFQIQHIQEYLERSLSAYQLIGKHVISAVNNGYIDWQGSFARSTQNEPDLRTFVSQYFNAADSSRVDQLYTNQDPERRYRSLWENNINLKTNINVPLEISGSNAKVMIGGSYINKYRNSDEEFYKLVPWGTVAFGGSPDNYVQDENIVDEEQDGFYYDNDKFSNQQASYVAKEVTIGGYGLFDIQLWKKFRIVAGIRYEQSNAMVENKIDTIEFSRRRQKAEYRRSDRTYRDVIPSLNITYSITEIMNLRAAFNRTLGRPSFRELAPYAYYDYFTSERIQGNPDLRRGLIDNFDLRWEYFFRPGELVSLSAFYKYFYSPIERYMDQSANETIRYRNGEDAHLYGIEAEFRKDLDFIDILKDFEFGVNLTLVKSIVKEDTVRVAKARVTVSDFPDTRPMYGQSPYMFNTFLFYNNERLGINANAGFNISGPKIIQISAVQTPDIYEQPVPFLSFGIGKTIGDRISISVRGTNMLKKSYRKTYTLDGQEYIYRSFNPGREFKLALSYTIN